LRSARPTGYHSWHRVAEEQHREGDEGAEHQGSKPEAAELIRQVFLAKTTVGNFNPMGGVKFLSCLLAASCISEFAKRPQQGQLAGNWISSVPISLTIATDIMRQMISECVGAL
jgi:hypothetical protein